MENQTATSQSRRRNAPPQKKTKGESSRTAVQRFQAESEVAELATAQFKATKASPISSRPTSSTAPIAPATADMLNPEEIMREFLHKFGRGVNASELFARMAAACHEEKAVETLTPLEIPPRPQSLIETPTAQALNSLRNNPSTPTEALPPQDTLPQDDTKTITDCPERGIEAINVQEGRLGVEGVDVGTESAYGTESGDGGDVEPTVVGVSGKNRLGTEEDVQIDELQELLERMLGNPDEAESLADVEGAGINEKVETMIEAEIIVLDDVISDEKDAPADERLVRRQLRQLKRLEYTSAERELEPSGTEGTDEGLPPSREVPTEKALDEHYV